mgnify:CR=1 FL=1
MSIETVVFIYACAILISAYGLALIGIFLYCLARIVIEDIKAKKEKRHER